MGGATSYKLLPVLTYSIGKCTDVFRGDWFKGEKLGGTWEDLSMEEFVTGEENFNEGVRFSSII